MPLPSRRPGRTLVASAYKVGDRESDYQRRKSLPWQKRALEVTTLVPEINFASRFYSRMTKQLRIFPATIDAQDQKTEITNGLPVEVLNRIRDPGGGRSAILSSYGRLMFITGEGLLFGRDLETDRERWSFVWNDEIKVEENSDGSVKKIIHKLSGSTIREYGPEQAVVYRMWTPSPERSYEAESPLRAGLEIAEELILLTMGVNATTLSRMTNGLLFLPTEIAPPPAESGSDEDPYMDPWSEDFLNNIERSIQDPASAAGRAPLISWVMGEHIDKIKFIPIHDPATDYMERDLRSEAITRLAYGMDMPPEALKGLGNTNHWAAMQILGDMWKSHGAPIAEQFCDELASAYLQPALRDLDYPDWAHVVVDFDASQVTVKPDRSDDADQAAKLAAISQRGYRIMKNIPEEWAPSEEDRKQWLEALGKLPRQQPQQQQPVDRERINGSDPAADGPEPPGPEGDSGRRTRVVTSSAESYEAMGAAMMALARCRELAGIRLWQKQRNCPDCFEKADGAPHALVASIVGPGVVEKLGWEPLRLVRGGTDTFRDMLVYWDFTPKQADAVCEMIESFAARTLYDERLPQLPVGFATHLERAKEADNALAGS